LPNAGLRTYNGQARKEWKDIDPSYDWQVFYPSTPGILAWLKHNNLHGRSDVDEVEDLSASQLQYAPRRLMLMATRPYYQTVKQLIGAAMGTKAHDIIEDHGKEINMLSEVRLKFGNLSAKNDLFDPVSGILEDLKHIGWYAVKKILEKGIMDPDGGLHYAYQTNLWRVIAETPEGLEQLAAKGFTPKGKPFITEQKLTIIPRDLTGSNKKEASKIIQDAWCLVIDIPFIDNDTVLGEYHALSFAKKDAVESGYAPLCPPEKRWERGNGYPAMCVEFCPVIEECLKMAKEHGEEHPADTWAMKKFGKSFEVGLVG
jgi:hypothetical protein